MKTKKTILLILSILCLFTAKLFAQGTSCANATGIKGGLHADFSFQPKQQARWFTFVATSSRVDVQVTRTTSVVDTPFAHVDSLILYTGTCGSLTQLRYAAKTDSGFYDSLPDIQALNLTPGQTYYVKVSRHLTNGNAGLAYFGFNQSYLAGAIIPSCAIGACGTNLLCNGDFESTPSWATSNSYQDSSDAFKATPPGAPQNTYCISSPNMRYYNSIFGGFACTGDYDYTDIYRIGTTMSSTSFNNTAHSGKWFMGVDCPSNECYECSSNPNRCTNNLTTTNYICTAWQQTITVVPGATYIFECWIENMDAHSGGPYSNGATVSMEINGGSPFFQDVITGVTYASWTKVCYNWTAPAGVTHAKIQVFGQGTAAAGGYDFSLDDFSFSMAKLAVAVNSTTSCPGGSATLTVSPAITGATYVWSNGATTSSITVSPSVTTTYTVTETVGKCTAADSGTVTINAPVVTLSSTTTCAGSCNATATATVTGGTAPYTYSWSNGETTSTATGLCPGMYTVTVTDAHGCVTKKTIRILAVGPPIVHVTSATICTGSSATICASGSGTSGFSWNTGATTACITVSPTTTTVYTVTGTNGYCTALATGTVTVNPAPHICLTDSVEICPNTCVTLSGLCKRPIPGITYNWTPGTGLSGNVNTYSVTACPTTNTTYTLTETNSATGCSATATEVVTLYPAPTIVMSSTPTCRGFCNATATATVTSGTGPYTYSWSTGQTTQTISGLCPGIYTVSVTDGHGCVTTATIKILAVAPPILHVSSTTICAGSNGTICASGTATNYTWNTGATTACITASPAATTVYTVTGSNGLCSANATGTITVNPLPRICITNMVDICPNTCVTLWGRCPKTPPGFTYSWSPTATLSGNVNTYSVTACPTVNTTYTLTETNSATGCSATGTETVNIYPPAVIAISGTPTCFGSCTGTANASVTGGTAPFTYSWTPGGQTTSSISGLCPGVYTVTVTDAHGCVTTASINIRGIKLPIVTATSTTICEGYSGTICASGAGSYTWNTGATTACITMSPTATTVYTVTGSNGLCSANATGTITVNPTPSICLTDTIKLCPSSCATLDGACGKIKPGIVYNWLPTTGLTGNTHSYIVTACPTVTTTYTLTATYSATGCSTSKTVVVVVYPQTTVTMASTQTCSDYCNGTASATATGGIAPYTYSWAPGGQTTSAISALCAGTYTVNITDAHGCKSSGIVHITGVYPPILHVSSTTICAGTSGTICATGGTYYQWNTGSTTACITVSPSVTTTYTVHTSNFSNGFCKSTASGTVTVTVAPVLCLQDTIVICPNKCTTLNTGACKPEASTTYTWAPSTGLSATTGWNVTACPTVTTVYTLTATNSITGCTTTGTTTVVIFPSAFTITGPSGVICGTVNTYSVTPALPAPVVYNWFSTNPTQSGTGTTANIAFNSPGGTISWEPYLPSGCKAIVTYSVTCGLPKDAEHDGNSVSTLTTTNANVYPNPAGDKLNVQIELQANQQVEMCIYNSIGEVVKCETLKDNLSIVSTAELPAGIYFYRISNTDGGLVKADKVMIVH